MPCTSGCCHAFEDAFDASYADGDLRDYRKNGPSKSTRALLDAIRDLTDTRGATLLDIGGGVGAISHELMKDGLAGATDVDGSTAFIAKAREEAERLGHAERMSFLHGDFVTLAAQVEPADVVTLDRVICCYPDMPTLVGAAASKAQRVMGLVWPREAWWMHCGLWGFNLFERFSKYPLIQTLHHLRDVDAVAATHGLTMRAARNVGWWQVRVYAQIFNPVSTTPETK